MKNLKLLSALVMSRYMPTRKTICEVVDLQWETMQCAKVITTSHALTIYDIRDGSITRRPLSDIRAVRYTDKIQYPELPPAFKTPQKGDSLEWVMASIRASLHDVNDASEALYGKPLVIAVNFNRQCKVLEVHMSDLWKEIQSHIRHNFVNDLWIRYCTLVERYGADPDYDKICVYDRSGDGIPRGIRTPRRLKVIGGPLVIYKTQ